MGLTASMKAFLTKLRRSRKQQLKQHHQHDKISSNATSRRVKPAIHPSVVFSEEEVAARIVRDSKTTGKQHIRKLQQQLNDLGKVSDSSRKHAAGLPRSSSLLPPSSNNICRMRSLPSLSLLHKRSFQSPKDKPSASESPLSHAASDTSLSPPATSGSIKPSPSSDLPRCAASSLLLCPLAGPEASILRFLLVATLAIVTVFPPDVLVSLPPERRVPLGLLFFCLGVASSAFTYTITRPNTSNLRRMHSAPAAATRTPMHTDPTSLVTSPSTSSSSSSSPSQLSPTLSVHPSLFFVTRHFHKHLDQQQHQQHQQEQQQWRQQQEQQEQEKTSNASGFLEVSPSSGYPAPSPTYSASALLLNFPIASVRPVLRRLRMTTAGAVTVLITALGAGMVVGTSPARLVTCMLLAGVAGEGIADMRERRRGRKSLLWIAFANLVKFRESVDEAWAVRW